MGDVSLLRRPARAAALVAAGLALTACGSVTPGAAATVDGRTISMSTLDDTARVYCEFTAASAQQQGIQAIDNAEIRRQAATDLVLEQIARDIAGQRGLKRPAPAEIDPQQLESAFGARAPEVAKTLEKSQDLFNLLAVIGGYDSATPVTSTTSDALSVAGRELVLKEFAQHDVTFAPRLGLTRGGEPNQSIGSLSVAPVDLEAPTAEELPDTQRCSA